MCHKIHCSSIEKTRFKKSQSKFHIFRAARPEQVFYGGDIKGESAMTYFDDVGTRVVHTYQVQNLIMNYLQIKDSKLNLDWKFEILIVVTADVFWDYALQSCLLLARNNDTLIGGSWFICPLTIILYMYEIISDLVLFTIRWIDALTGKFVLSGYWCPWISAM